MMTVLVSCPGNAQRQTVLEVLVEFANQSTL